MQKAKKATVLVALPDENEIEKFKLRIFDFAKFKIIGESTDGYQACNVILKLKPDIIIIDIMLPGIDGLAVLERIQCLKPKYRPRILVISDSGDERVTERIFYLGATYMMLKPYNVDIVVERIKQFCMPDNIEEISVESIMEYYESISSYTTGSFEAIEYGYALCMDAASWILKSINTPMHLSGYSYILEALKIYLEHGKSVPCITKIVYPQIGKNFNVDSARVERCIRSAIDYIWLHGNIDIVESFFGNYIDYRMSGKPGNAQFLAMLCDMVKPLSKSRQVWET